MHPDLTGTTKAGTFGGTLLVLLLRINSEEVLKTIALAAIGAAVSFLVSLLIRSLISWWKNPEV